MSWLVNNMQTATQKWKVIGNQVYTTDVYYVCLKLAACANTSTHSFLSLALLLCHATLYIIQSYTTAAVH
jgi:hypothetical protein